MKCPICKKDALFVGVHDDEGNYHGLVGCDYESNPWSGLSYALHHDGWGECPLCTDGVYSIMGGMLFDTTEEAIATLTQQNEPLTIEQLQEQIGGPIIINETWCYLEKIVDGIAHCWRWYMDFADEWPLKQYRKTWIAYRHPPEKSEANNNGD